MAPQIQYIDYSLLQIAPYEYFSTDEDFGAGVGGGGGGVGGGVRSGCWC